LRNDNSDLRSALNKKLDIPVVMPAYLPIYLLLATINFAFVLSVGWYIKHHLVRKVYEVPLAPGQLAREIRNSFLTTPVHALILAFFVETGLLNSAPEAMGAIVSTFILTFVWTEVWHYVSHIAMHQPSLHFLHREHHLSRATNVWTSVSFSYLEKFIFSLGIIGFIAAISHVMPVSVYGVATYYVYYFLTNTLGHANIEIRSENYASTVMGKVLNTPAFHAMHHARYIKNYGLMTPILDRMFGTAWQDSNEVQRRAATRQPLQNLKEQCIVAQLDGKETRDARGGDA
jgi:Delta7-sterol 5-desaturase